MIGTNRSTRLLLIDFGDFLLHMFIKDLTALLYVLEIKDIFFWLCEPLQGLDVVPGVRDFSLIDGDAAEGSLDEFDLDLIIEGRVRMGEEGEKTL